MASLDPISPFLFDTPKLPWPNLVRPSLPVTSRLPWPPSSVSPFLSSRLPWLPSSVSPFLSSRLPWLPSSVSPFLSSRLPWPPSEPAIPPLSAGRSSSCLRRPQVAVSCRTGWATRRAEARRGEERRSAPLDVPLQRHRAASPTARHFKAAVRRPGAHAPSALAASSLGGDADRPAVTAAPRPAPRLARTPVLSPHATGRPPRNRPGAAQKWRGATNLFTWLPAEREPTGRCRTDSPLRRRPPCRRCRRCRLRSAPTSRRPGLFTSPRRQEALAMVTESTSCGEREGGGG